MKLCFDSIEEVKTFVDSLKGTRAKKSEKDETAGEAPAPLMPPQGQALQGFGATTQASVGFNPQGNTGMAFPAGPSPEILALVTKIVTRLGQATPGTEASALMWFRGQVTPHIPEAANATLDQIKDVFLPKLTQPALEVIAKLMGCT